MGRRMAAETIELLQGTLDLLVLKTLSWGSTHGYGIARWIQHVTRDVLRIEEGSLYPALHRLEKRGWIDLRAGDSPRTIGAPSTTTHDARPPAAPRRSIVLVHVLRCRDKGAHVNRSTHLAS